MIKIRHPKIKTVPLPNGEGPGVGLLFIKALAYQPSVAPLAEIKGRLELPRFYGH